MRKKAKIGKEDYIRLEVKLLNGADLVLELVRASVACCPVIACGRLFYMQSCKGSKSACCTVGQPHPDIPRCGATSSA